MIGRAITAKAYGTEVFQVFVKDPSEEVFQVLKWFSSKFSSTKY